MYQLILNLIPQGILPRINVSQYDHGQTVDVTLYEGSTAYTLPSGATVTVSGTKADNTGFEYNCTTTGGLSFTIADQMTVFAGEVECELTIRYGNNRISTINFILDVERAALQDDVVISETDLPILQQIPEYAAQASADADRAEQAAATAMSTDAGKVTDRLNLNNCRNLIVPADINYTLSGVTIKTNADGSITLSGARSGADFLIWSNLFDSNSGGPVDGNPQKWLPNGKYRFWGDIVGGRIDGKTYLQVSGFNANGENILYKTNNVSTYVDFEITEAVKVVRVRVLVQRNANFGTGMTIYPMITTQSTENVTGYEQGALSNRVLTIKAQEVPQDIDKVFQRAIDNGYLTDALDVDFTSIHGKKNQPFLVSTGAPTTNLPSVSTLYGVRRVEIYALTSTIKIIDVIIEDIANMKQWRNRYYNTSWSGWVGSQNDTDNTLTTTSKTIVGAINELKARIDAL